MFSKKFTPTPDSAGLFVWSFFMTSFAANLGAPAGVWLTFMFFIPVSVAMSFLDWGE
jgi:hypothetical protein